jgi:hypothetical protein
LAQAFDRRVNIMTAIPSIRMNPVTVSGNPVEATVIAQSYNREYFQEFLDAGVCDLGVVEVQLLGIAPPFQVLQASVGDAGVLELNY